MTGSSAGTRGCWDALKRTTTTIGRTLTFVMILGLGTASAQTLHLPAHEKVVLKNGLTVLLLEKHGVPMVNLYAIVKTGSASDPAGEEGLASAVGPEGEVPYGLTELPTAAAQLRLPPDERGAIPTVLSLLRRNNFRLSAATLATPGLQWRPMGWSPSTSRRKMRMMSLLISRDPSAYMP